MLTIGCHLSTTKGYRAMGETALSIGANTFAFFTRNPRGGKAKDLDMDDVAALRELMAQNDFGPLVAHAPYTYNPCSAKERAREFALEAMAEDLRRMEALPGNYYNFHPGAHVGQGSDAGIQMIVDTLCQVMFEGQQTTVLLETVAVNSKMHRDEIKQYTDSRSVASVDEDTQLLWRAVACGRSKESGRLISP